MEEKNTLGEVIEAERAIRARLEEERRKAGQFLKEVEEEAARELEEAELKLRESLERTVREAEAEALRRAEALRLGAEERARKLRGLDDAALRGHVLRHIAAILPETP